MAGDGEAQVPEPKRISGDEARSHLAGERTLLAWWRSGLAALAVSLAVGRVIPALIDESKGWFVALGVGFAMLALAFTLYGTSRQRRLDRVDRRRGLPAGGRQGGLPAHRR